MNFVATSVIIGGGCLSTACCLGMSCLVRKPLSVTIYVLSDNKVSTGSVQIMPHNASSDTCFDFTPDLKSTRGSDIPEVRVTAGEAHAGELGGGDLKTPSVSPNNSFLEVSKL